MENSNILVRRCILPRCTSHNNKPGKYVASIVPRTIYDGKFLAKEIAADPFLERFEFLCVDVKETYGIPTNFPGPLWMGKHAFALVYNPLKLGYTFRMCDQ